MVHSCSCALVLGGNFSGHPKLSDKGWWQFMQNTAGKLQNLLQGNDVGWCLWCVCWVVLSFWVLFVFFSHCIATKCSHFTRIVFIINSFCFLSFIQYYYLKSLLCSLLPTNMPSIKFSVSISNR